MFVKHYDTGLWQMSYGSNVLLVNSLALKTVLHKFKTKVIWDRDAEKCGHLIIKFDGAG